jgi:TolB-like protein/Flp pilus assembly protein TadD
VERARGSEGGGDRLDSWKEIAAYLKRGARTVQRWESEEGLPVHRLIHGKLGSIYAYQAELDAWWASREAELANKPPLPAEAAPSVAVLPFADMSQERDQAYFCEGMAEEILDALSRIRGLRVSSRTASFHARTPGADTREIGRRLRVGTLLEGSVRKSGDQLRIVLQLTDAESGFHLWSGRYDRRMSDIFAIQREIAENVVRALEVTLSRNERTALGKPGTADVRAYDCYLRGRKFYYQYSPQGVEFALRMFIHAMELDPNYPQAYAGLADCWSYLYLYCGRSEAVREQADWASARAVEMDPRSAQAWASRGLSLSLSGRNEEAEKAFDLAIRLAPDLFEAYYFHAHHHLAMGQLEKAARLYEESMRVRPEDYQSPFLVAQIYDDLGRPADGIAARKRGIEVAERHLRLNPDDARALYMAANALVALGEHAQGRQWAERALAIRPDDPMLLYNAGCVFSLVGRVEPAIECLEKAARNGLTQKGWYQHDSSLDPLRKHPRFRELVRKLC